MASNRLNRLVVFVSLAVAYFFANPSFGTQEVFGKRTNVTAKKTDDTQQNNGFSVSNIHWNWLSYPGGGKSDPSLMFSLRNETGLRVAEVSFQVKFFDRRGKELHTESQTFRQEISPDSSSIVKVGFDDAVGFSLKRTSRRQKVIVVSYEEATGKTGHRKWGNLVDF